MTASLHDIRALVTLVDRSPWRELYVRTDGWTAFLAKPGAGPNPMRQPVPAIAETVADTFVIRAPHLGLFTASLPVGSVVDVDAVVGMIEVLGSFSEVCTDLGGVIESVPAASGALVEYGAPLVLIRPA
jgi:acetyl-CoA carboxylase biotin carboxyl carrier protein